jgi:hypothetical protein
MDVVDRESLVSLAQHRGWPSVSIYLPTHRAGDPKDQDPIRLKNLIRQACERLVAEGLRDPEADAFLAPARALVEDDVFWRQATDGLAVFISRDGSRIFQTDITLPEQAIVGGRFFLRALARAYKGDMRFFALAFDRNGARLFEGDRVSIRELELKDAPASFADEVKYDNGEEIKQNISFGSPESAQNAGPRVSIFHGHAAQNFDKNELARYANDLERAVTRRLGPENKVPLLLMGVDYQLVAYREANTYEALASEQVTGAVDYLTEREVHDMALETLQPRFDAAAQADLAELRERPSQFVTTDPTEIVSAAATGRVKSLFFDESSGPFGIFNPDLVAVEGVCSAAPRYLRDTADSEVAPDECGWDLVDLAVAETVLHGGTVHAFDGEDAPVAGVAAVLRY